MARSIVFNKGTLNIDQEQVTWEVADSEVQCATLGELDALKQARDFAVPLQKIERVEKQLRFTWELPEGYRPLSSIRQKHDLYKLKMARDMIGVAQIFEADEKLATIFEPVNVYIDPYHHVRVLFYTHPLYLPCQAEYEQDSVAQVKNLIVYLFTSITEKELHTLRGDDWVQKCKQEKQDWVGQCLQADTLSNMKQVIEYEVDRIQTLHHENSQKLEAQKGQPARRKSVFVVGGFGLILLLAVFFLLSAYMDASTDEEEISALEERLAQQEQDIQEVEREAAHDRAYVQAYQAYYEGDMEEALTAVESVDGELNGLEEDFYVELLVQNGRAQEVIEQDAQLVETVLQHLVDLEWEEDILSLEADHPAVLFEQAVIKENNELLIDVQEELDQLSERQEQLLFEAHLRQDVVQAREYAQEMGNVEFEIAALQAQVERIEDEIDDLDEDDDEEEIEDLEEDIEDIEDEIASLEE